jgi:hypothetical protein
LNVSIAPRIAVCISKLPCYIFTGQSKFNLTAASGRAIAAN